MWRKSLARGTVDELAFTGDGASLVMLWDGFIYAWDLATRKARNLSAGTSNGIRELTPSPDGRHVLATSWTSGVWSHSTTPGEESATRVTKPARGGGTAFLDGGLVLLTLDSRLGLTEVDEPTGLRAWDWPSLGEREVPGEFQEAGTDQLIGEAAGTVAVLAMNHYGPPSQAAILSVGGDGGLAATWLPDHLANLFGWHAVSGAARAFIVSTRDRLLVRNLPDGGPRCEVALESDEKLRLAFHPDGHLFAVASADGTVRFLDAMTGDVRQAFDWKIGRVKCVAFSPDGLLCAAGGDKQSFVVWDVDD